MKLLNLPLKIVLKPLNILILEYMNPELNEFKNTTYTYLSYYGYDGYRKCECWTDSPCLFVSRENEFSFFKKIEEYKIKK
jgi:hypothetical protein